MTNKPPLLERELLTCVAKGNELAFRQLFDEHRAAVYSVALKLLKSASLAEDVVQEVFMKVWHNREALSRVEKFKGYLFTITRNRVFDEFKKIAREATILNEPAEDASVVNDADHVIRKKQLEGLLEQALHQLPRQQQYIYHLSRKEGMTYQEIGERLNLSPLTVKTHMKKTLAFLRSHLSTHFELYLLLFFNGVSAGNFQ